MKFPEPIYYLPVDKPMSASLFDFGMFFFNNQRAVCGSNAVNKAAGFLTFVMHKFFDEKIYILVTYLVDQEEQRVVLLPSKSRPCLLCHQLLYDNL